MSCLVVVFFPYIVFVFFLYSICWACLVLLIINTVFIWRMRLDYNGIGWFHGKHVDGWVCGRLRFVGSYERRILWNSFFNFFAIFAFLQVRRQIQVARLWLSGPRFWHNPFHLSHKYVCDLWMKTCLVSVTALYKSTSLICLSSFPVFHSPPRLKEKLKQQLRKMVTFCLMWHIVHQSMHNSLNDIAILHFYHWIVLKAKLKCASSSRWPVSIRLCMLAPQLLTIFGLYGTIEEVICRN